METSLRLHGDDNTSRQQLGIRIHAKQKLPLAYNTLLQAHAEIDTATRKPSLLALLARHFFPQLSANVGAGVQLERGNIFRYTLRAKKAVSFTDDGLLGLREEKDVAGWGSSMACTCAPNHNRPSHALPLIPTVK
ncbi:outer envelope pore protein 21, chloroplastic-like [Triticum dicoccoides]|uniref:outer envelope pore protein 21, chloroplastic-like n=1 Tax=Triticum dicoccoides TaxID=85692 RepID=UPI00189159DD|nr:outer envelope pore protein 21, chloroplastic-like [Triticum dicoccoides]